MHTSQKIHDLKVIYKFSSMSYMSSPLVEGVMLNNGKMMQHDDAHEDGEGEDDDEGEGDDAGKEKAKL